MEGVGLRQQHEEEGEYESISEIPIPATLRCSPFVRLPVRIGRTPFGSAACLISASGMGQSRKRITGPRRRIANMKRIGMGVAALALLSGASMQSARAEENVIKIGTVAAESGAFVSAGNTIPAAVKLAVKEINDAGGIRVGGKTDKFDAYYRHDRTNICTATAAVRDHLKQLR